MIKISLDLFKHSIAPHKMFQFAIYRGQVIKEFGMLVRFKRQVAHAYVLGGTQ